MVTPREWEKGAPNAMGLAGGLGMHLKQGQQRTLVCSWLRQAVYDAAFVEGGGRTVIERLPTWDPGGGGMKAHVPAH